ncbi:MULTISPECIES: hypothetical protein [Rhodomicrobium]|uniref:hypothetical protein n=1 Tax=Rhodomicrobium TaxID=1068 RepID=UPI000B4AC3E4|nr:MULTISPECIES: hypothetical protein [Rhodomicrobium]
MGGEVGDAPAARFAQARGQPAGAAFARAAEAARGRSIVAAQDTTEINFAGRNSRAQGRHGGASPSGRRPKQDPASLRLGLIEARAVDPAATWTSR